MKIIRDNELGGIAMIPLCIDWNIRRCNVKGCTDQPNTIVVDLAPNAPLVGFCETHYQAANTPDGAAFTLVFDDFNAFAARYAQPAAGR